MVFRSISVNGNGIQFRKRRLNIERAHSRRHRDTDFFVRHESKRKRIRFIRSARRSYAAERHASVKACVYDVRVCRACMTEVGGFVAYAAVEHRAFRLENIVFNTFSSVLLVYSAFINADKLFV